MMFVYHYLIIPFHPQYLPRHAPLILQGAGCQRAGCRWLRIGIFTLLSVKFWCLFCACQWSDEFSTTLLYWSKDNNELIINWQIIAFLTELHSRDFSTANETRPFGCFLSSLNIRLIYPEANCSMIFSQGVLLPKYDHMFHCAYPLKLLNMLLIN